MTTSIHAQLSGDWKGAIDVQGMSLELIFHIEETANGHATTMDVPMQGASGVPVDETTLDGNKVSLKLNQLQINFEGELEGETISGTFYQSGMELPLTLSKFESKLPGDTSLPSTDEELEKLAAQDKGAHKYKVEDYFAKPKASSFQLSPDGKYLSYQEKDDNNKRHVYVKEIATGKVIRAVEEGDELIRGYGWASDDRLIYVMDQGGDENYHIYASDLDGGNTKDLTPFDGVRAGILSILKEQKDHIIVSLNKNNPQVFEPYKLNIHTGELEQLFENTDPANPIQDYLFDKDGNLRGYYKLKDGVNVEFHYQNTTTGQYELLTRNNWDDTFAVLGLNYASENPDETYVMTNLDSDKAKIVLYDLKKKETLKEVFSHPTYDVGGLNRSRKRNYEVDYYHYNGEKNVIVPVSKTYKKLHQLMEKEFKGKQFQIADADDDETRFLILIQSDKHYGSYYELDAKTQKFRLLYDLMPQLKEADMAEMRPITFTSRDGLTLHGYITLPKEALKGKKVPMVVNPHGGPQGIRDSWGFNPEAQLFASRGYATLQVNFRISGGYGKEFLRAGFKQIGRKCMDDVTDGVQYAIEQGWANPDKIAIYGGSHGGYATLMGLIKTPDLYTCGVNYVGVSNIETFYASFPEYWKPLTAIVKQIWYDLDNPEEAEIARSVSPVYQVDKIKKPLFVVQGANDPRVNINESDQIVTALRKKGFPTPYMVKYNEGHGFGHEENSLDLYRCMMGFFAEHLQ